MDPQADDWFGVSENDIEASEIAGDSLSAGRGCFVAGPLGGIAIWVTVIAAAAAWWLL